MRRAIVGKSTREGGAVKISMLLLAMCATLMAATERIYVANSGGDDLSVIDPATNAVTATISVSDHPHGIVVSPDKMRLYASSEGEDVLDVVDLSTSKVIRRRAAGATAEQPGDHARRPARLTSASAANPGSTSSTPPRSRWSRACRWGGPRTTSTARRTGGG